MKIYKEKEHSLAVRPFGFAGKSHITATVTLFYDLTAPGTLLSEQQLWKTVPDLLQPLSTLDQGLPKPAGEFLVTGSCFAPRGETRAASDVKVRVGNTSKSLYVFGERYWLHNRQISNPEPFAEMPLVWERAFGGEGFPSNPLGRGLHPEVDAKGGEYVRLPNIEYPGQLIGSQEDRPHPAGFGVVDQTWPQRAKKTGVYDEKWLRERWPYFPADMNPSFFNTAFEDQQTRAFFKGDEAIEILNMHPDIQRIESSLPGVRIRIFFTIRKDYKPFAKDTRFEEEFVEVETKCDTVWLLPSVLRGMVLFRGSMESADDELRDVVRVFVVTEHLKDAPKPKEFYFEALRKRLDRSVPLDMAPFEEANREIAKARLTLRKLPKELKQIKQSILGKTPVFKRTPLEMEEQVRTLTAGQLKRVDALESMAGEMHARWGHLVGIDLTVFDKLRDKVKGASGRLGDTAKKIHKAKNRLSQKKEETLKQQTQIFKDNYTPRMLEKYGIDPDCLQLSEEKEHPWHTQGFPQVVQWRKNLEKMPPVLELLGQMGLQRETMEKAWLGWNPDALEQRPPDWGLEAKPPEEKLALPAGLVLPRFDGPLLNRILIRPAGEEGDNVTRPMLTANAADKAVKGSDTTPLFLEAAIPGGPVVVLADELQTLYAEQELGDFCGVLCLSSPGETPPPEASDAVKAASLLVVVLPCGARKDHSPFKDWQKAFGNATLLALPEGETVFDARLQGHDLRKLVLDLLPPEQAGAHNLEDELPEPGKPPSKHRIKPLPFPDLDIGALVRETMGEFKAAQEAHFAGMRESSTETLATVQKSFAAKGLDLDSEASLAKAAATPVPEPEELAGELARKIEQERLRLEGKKMLTPAMDEKFKTQAAQCLEVGSRLQSVKAQALSKMAELQAMADARKQQLEMRKLPPEAEALLKRHGIDSDAFAPLTREEVVRRHARGESLVRANLMGLDLSKLDLSGIDLREALMQDADFSETILDNAVMNRSVAMGANFTKASLKNAGLKNSVLNRARFIEADLSGSSLDKAVFNEADCTKADFTGARMYLFAASNAVFTEAVFSEADMELACLTDAALSRAAFRNARMFKVLLRNALLDKADFRGATMRQTLLMSVSGEEVSFAGGNLDKFRLSHGSRLPGADFCKTSLQEAYFSDSELPQATFNDSVLDRAMLTNCSMPFADLNRISAQKTRITKCDLEHANLQGINLFLGSLRKSRLVKADLSLSNLYAVDFYKCVVGETNFDKANLKRSQLYNRTDLIR